MVVFFYCKQGMLSENMQSSSYCTITNVAYSLGFETRYIAYTVYMKNNTHLLYTTETILRVKWRIQLLTSHVHADNQPIVQFWSLHSLDTMAHALYSDTILCTLYAKTNWPLSCYPI